MLKSIVEYIYNNEGENILVLAYTNRAVDEICGALKKIGGDFSFLRLGSKESSEAGDVLISNLALEIPLRDLFIKIRQTRVFVSTVSSALTNPEIFEIKKFDTAIVDEASQILEPHLTGILAGAGRFIMIGDEKQLPSIVTQPETGLIIDENSPQHESLGSIGLTNLSSSLFERLLRLCIKNEWTNAYGSLARQARMHRDIQEFSNIMFYDNTLEPFPGSLWQNEDTNIFTGSGDALSGLLARSRTIFIESDYENTPKLHLSEALRAARIIKNIRDIAGNGFTGDTVGVISPFRAQCAKIKLALPEDLRGQVLIDTVERFQGSERDIVIISFAVNHMYHARNLQSLTKIGAKIIDRKLNVALTRARKHLILLGNPQLLERLDIYRELIEYIKNKGGFISALECDNTLSQ